MKQPNITLALSLTRWLPRMCWSYVFMVCFQPQQLWSIHSAIHHYWVSFHHLNIHLAHSTCVDVHLPTLPIDHHVVYVFYTTGTVGISSCNCNQQPRHLDKVCSCIRAFGSSTSTSSTAAIQHHSLAFNITLLQPPICIITPLFKQATAIHTQSSS